MAQEEQGTYVGEYRTMVEPEPKQLPVELQQALRGLLNPSTADPSRQ